jgi:hypothetical protein
LGKAELVTEGMEQGKGGLAVGGAKNSGSLANNGQTEGKGLVTGHWFVDEHGLPDMAEFMKDTALVRNVRVAVVECRFQSLATVVNNEREATFALDARRIKASQQAVPGVGIFAGRQSSSSLRPLSGQSDENGDFVFTLDRTPTRQLVSAVLARGRQHFRPDGIQKQHWRN